MTKTRILVTDDENNMRLTLTDILEEEGYEVATASNGEEAVRMCSEQSFDVIMMDVRMPGIDGLEATRRIRHHQREVCVIIMSAYTTTLHKKTALAEDVFAFVSKPFKMDHVLEVVGRAEVKGKLHIEE